MLNTTAEIMNPLRLIVMREYKFATIINHYSLILCRCMVKSTSHMCIFCYFIFYMTIKYMYLQAAEC